MRLSNRCYAVTGLGYSSPWCVNAGFIAGDAVTLVVDSGANNLAAQTIYGYACAVAPHNEIQVINTERHFDHIGGNGFFRVQCGAHIFGHSGIKRTQAEFQTEIAEFSAAIPGLIRREREEGLAFFHGTGLQNPTRPIHRDTQFDLGGCPVEVLMTPGHTSTNLSVWVPDDRVVYTGDCLIAEYLPNLDAGGPEDWKTWLQSIDRLDALRPEFAVMGHGPVARGSEEVARVMETVREVLRQSIARGCSPTARGR